MPAMKELNPNPPHKIIMITDETSSLSTGIPFIFQLLSSKPWAWKGLSLFRTHTEIATA
ncbi:MAG: hypothetical protein AAB863_01350 [Patescibacteria group bacterium]